MFLNFLLPLDHVNIHIAVAIHGCTSHACDKIDIQIKRKIDTHIEGLSITQLANTFKFS
jgi:hypothetical protein